MRAAHGQVVTAILDKAAFKEPCHQVRAVAEGANLHGESVSALTTPGFHPAGCGGGG